MELWLLNWHEAQGRQGEQKSKKRKWGRNHLSQWVKQSTRDIECTTWTGKDVGVRQGSGVSGTPAWKYPVSLSEACSGPNQSNLFYWRRCNFVLLSSMVRHKHANRHVFEIWDWHREGSLVGGKLSCTPMGCDRLIPWGHLDFSGNVTSPYFSGMNPEKYVRFWWGHVSDLLLESF